ncbi:nuclear transport factor 2 family protein [Nocardia sp. NPDC049707]|uniref:nuclear transport factor 2 family protein n=1 Tax=Nocardia sp. NPDC049707 TaxID=3154735 RepID=UPI00343315E2
MAAKIRDVIEQYVKLVGSGPTEAIVDLYAPDAVVQDPMGTDPKRGHDAIREFYEVLGNLDRETKLHADSIRIAGNHAAFMFTLVTKFGDQRLILSPIDAMDFDDEGKIVAMRAYWGQDDMRNEAP